MNWRRAIYRAGRICRYVPATISVAVICYLALKPSPSVAEVPFMPRWLGRWLDHEDFLCNVSGYLVLTIVIHATFSGWRRAAAGVVWRRAAWLGVLVAGLECGQLFLPRRFFDLHDIASGWLGVVVASLPWLVLPVKAATPKTPGLAKPAE